MRSQRLLPLRSPRILAFRPFRRNLCGHKNRWRLSMRTPKESQQAESHQTSREALTEKIWRHISRNYVSRVSEPGRQILKIAEPRMPQPPFFSEPSSAKLDGEVGAALVTDVMRSLDVGNSLERETLKEVILECLREKLQCPVRRNGSDDGIYRLSLEAAASPPVFARVVDDTSERAISLLPPEISDLVRAFCGDFWWGVESSSSLPATSKSIHHFTIHIQGDRRIRRVIKRVLPFACNSLRFGNGDHIHAEWSSDEKLVWMRAPNCLAFVHLLRHSRKKARRRNADLGVSRLGNEPRQTPRVLNVKGYGTALI